MQRQLMLISSSTVYGYTYLDHCAADIITFLNKMHVKRVLFVPYALKDHEKYTNKVKDRFEKMGFGIESIHQTTEPIVAVEKAEAIFIGGGNTFRLLKSLYDNKLIEPIRARVFQGTPFIGSSAGTNVATDSIKTTNDMPIVYPPSFDALKLVPFNINPHYADPDYNSTHMGETREQRINEFLEENNKIVLGIREGCHLIIEGNQGYIRGLKGAVLFKSGQAPQQLEVGAAIHHLLE